MNTNRESKLMKLAAILAIATIDAYADERRTKGDRIVISIPDRKLVLLSGNSVLKIYDVAVGKPTTPSPRGEFTIISHVKNPTWYGPHIVVPPGKNNPLGTRWMGLSAKGYGIHGTNVPSSVGKSASHGCIRMRQSDLEQLFDMVDVGVTVELRGERPQLLAQALAVPAAESLP
jgi:L,D-transpeptidase ErfK/SrfK